MWLEGYEAARRAMRRLVQECHHAQEAQGQGSTAWLQFAHEMLREEVSKYDQRAEDNQDRSTEKASGSTDL
eukprot:6888069-Heterocapsa_arctica.AAC.1